MMALFHSKVPANSADGTIAPENVPMDKDDVLTKLRELKPTITARYKVREIGLFGSFVRGEQEASSDIIESFTAGMDLDIFHTKCRISISKEMSV